MADTFRARPAPFGAITIYAIVRRIDTALGAFRRWRVAQETDTELRKLSDRELWDIGLSRGWLEDVSGEFAGRAR